ncbi:MAG: carboxypeptidase regulatory-like domain-containing protein [candidate division WOR-3 bacterium]|nr:MAG: carboxypeptidase regulatory-like domain-containing protein [candidate division WOR-3 bacterium]
MRGIALSCIVILLVTTACLEPERNNPYDPNNPDKGYLAGTAYDNHNQSLPGALVTLKIGDEEKYSTQTHIYGDYEFPEVDPGLYTLVAEAASFITQTYDNVEIKSYTYNDTFDLYFQPVYSGSINVLP